MSLRKHAVLTAFAVGLVVGGLSCRLAPKPVSPPIPAPAAGPSLGDVLDTLGVMAPQHLPANVDDLLEHPWFDPLPHSDRDPFRKLLFRWVGTGKEAWGYLKVADSAYHYTLDWFHWSADEATVEFHFLHDHVQGATPYRVERVPPDADGVDMRLTLEQDPSSPGQPRVYYTSSTWHEASKPPSQEMDRE